LRRAGKRSPAPAAWAFAAASILAAFLDQLLDRNGAAQRNSFAQPLHLGEPFFAGFRGPGGRDGREHRHRTAVTGDRDSLTLLDLIEQLRQLGLGLECADGLHADLLNWSTSWQYSVA